MSQTFFTSDPHLGHPLVSELRGFADPADHDVWYGDVWRAHITMPLHGHTHIAEQRVHDGRQVHVGIDAWRAPVPASTIIAIINGGQ